MSLQEIADQVVRGKLRFSPQQVRVLIELLPFHMPKLGDSPPSPDRRGLLFKIGARPSAHRGRTSG